MSAYYVTVYMCTFRKGSIFKLLNLIESTLYMAGGQALPCSIFSNTNPLKVFRLTWPSRISIIFTQSKVIIKRSLCAKFYVDWPSRFRDTIDQSFVSRYGFHGKNEENRVSWGLWFSNNFIPVAILTVFPPSTWMPSLITELMFTLMLDILGGCCGK